MWSCDGFTTVGKEIKVKSSLTLPSAVARNLCRPLLALEAQGEPQVDSAFLGLPVGWMGKNVCTYVCACVRARVCVLWGQRVPVRLFFYFYF